MTATPASGTPRFAFGRNWSRFLRHLTPAHIAAAEQSLRKMLGVESLAGSRMLDIGSGSGLSSLAARQLGARVHSFDYDADSVRCTEQLRDRWFPGDADWMVEQGSVLDEGYMQSLGTFELVYSWGVLHHTGDMWRALDFACRRVAPGGRLWIALYNDQGRISRYWTQVKRLYNTGDAGRWAMTVLHAPYLVGGRAAARALTGRLRLERGMSLWIDVHDWLGGLPFEVATPAAVEAFLLPRGFRLIREIRCGRRHGCNEFVLQRSHS